MTKASATGSKQEDFIKIQDEVFHVGDCILVKGESSKKPFVGKIRGFRNKNKGIEHTKINVHWFYRPEECKSGRRKFHGDKELFKSNHADTVDAETVLSKCDVHSLSAYRLLDDEDEADFFCRFSYDPAVDKFGPEIVPVYCLCEMPYNPDTYMIMCGICEDWYHPRCLGMKDEKMKKYDTEQFYCPRCKNESAPKPKTRARK